MMKMDRVKKFFLAVVLLVPFLLVNIILLRLKEEGNLDTSTTDSKRYRIGATKDRELETSHRVDVKNRSGGSIAGAEFEGEFICSCFRR
jgi:hypothetical protein